MPTMRTLRAVLVACALVGIVRPVSAQDTATPTQTATPTPTVTDTATQTFTVTKTPTPTPTVTKTQTPTKTPIMTKTPTPAPANTNTKTETPTATVTPTVTQTPTATCGPVKDKRGIANASFCHQVCPTATGTPAALTCYGTPVPADNAVGRRKVVSCSEGSTTIQTMCYPHYTWNWGFGVATNPTPIAVGTPFACGTGFASFDDTFDACFCAIQTPGPTPVTCYVDRLPDGMTQWQGP